jgi:hypothetical protein
MVVIVCRWARSRSIPLCLLFLDVIGKFAERLAFVRDAIRHANIRTDSPFRRSCGSCLPNFEAMVIAQYILNGWVETTFGLGLGFFVFE